MIENNTLLENTNTYTRYEMDEDPDDENSIDQDENLNQIVEDYEEKQLVKKQPEQATASDNPKTEAELIGEIRDLNRKMNLSSILAYWHMGRKINSFYQGKYGTGELQKIAEQTAVSQDSLTKACKFARQYSEEQLQDLIHGNFQLSWFQIAQNLSVEPQKLIGVYREVRNPSEFHNGIMKLKDLVEKRGKVMKIKTSDNAKITAAAETSGLPDRNDAPLPESGVFYDDPEEPPFNDQVIDVMAEPKNEENDPAYESYRLELESVKAENVERKAKIEELQATYGQLEKDFVECERKRVRLEKIGKDYHALLNQIIDVTKKGAPTEGLYARLMEDQFTPYRTGEIFNV